MSGPAKRVRVVYHDGTEETIDAESIRVEPTVLHLFGRPWGDDRDTHIPLTSIRKWERLK